MTLSITLRVSAVVVVLILLQGESSATRVLTSNDTNGFWDHTTIILYNDIDTALTVHCRSKDDDLGFHVLQQGESWQFSFDPNFFGNTLFYGSFQWDGQLHYFDVYNQARDYVYKEITWSVRTPGLCYTFHGHEYCYSWNS